MKILIESSCTVNSSFYSNLKSNAYSLGGYPLILVSDQCLLRILLRSTESFRMRVAVHGYP